MSRFYFHIRSGGVFVPDEEGMELRDMRAAFAELRASADDLARAELLLGHGLADQSVEIQDAAGVLLESMSIRRTLN